MKKNLHWGILVIVTHVRQRKFSGRNGFTTLTPILINRSFSPLSLGNFSDISIICPCCKNNALAIPNVISFIVLEARVNFTKCDGYEKFRFFIRVDLRVRKYCFFRVPQTMHRQSRTFTLTLIALFQCYTHKSGQVERQFVVAMGTYAHAHQYCTSPVTRRTVYCSPVPFSLLMRPELSA